MTDDDWFVDAVRAQEVAKATGSSNAPSYQRTRAVMEELNTAVTLLRGYTSVADEETRSFILKHTSAPYGRT